jgi:maltose alpha-D-glucosyltransferase / alpha-amylase
MREFLSWRQGDAVLLAEANVTTEDVAPYFDEGRRMHLVFNFPANQRLFLALAEGDAAPLAQTLASAPRLRSTSQWAHFLRNHDELDLGRLSEEERHRVFRRLGPEERMQIYDRGIRRRLAPMLGGDRRRIELAFAVLLALPGTPVLWYGEEIGMGEDLDLDGRASVRTPMQWSTAPHAGFSAAREVFRKVVSHGPFSFERVNVASQRLDPDSLLNRLERLVRMRKECPEIGWGDCSVLDAGDRRVLGLRYENDGAEMVTLHSFSEEPREAVLSLESEGRAWIVDVFSGERVAPAGGTPRFKLEPYGYRWFRVAREGRGSE